MELKQTVAHLVRVQDMLIRAPDPPEHVIVLLQCHEIITVFACLAI